MTNRSVSTERRPLLFISHTFDDRNAASKVAERLKIISNRLDIYLSSNPTFEGPRVGKSINASLKEALGKTSLVLLIFSTMGKDWSWCMWECGIATDPNDETPTNVATLSLSEDAPKPYEDTLVVKMSDLASVLTFVNQLCTEPDFFPDLGEPLTKRTANDDFIKEQAAALHAEIEEFTKLKIVEQPRWGGFSISVDSGTSKTLKSLDKPPSGKKLNELLKDFLISNPIGWGLHHFGFTEVTEQMTLAELRKRWIDTRGDNRVQNTPWTQVIADELWRIITTRPTNMTWEPFLSVKDGISDLWVYPFVYKYRKHSSGRFEFDLLVIQSIKPEV